MMDAMTVEEKVRAAQHGRVFPSEAAKRIACVERQSAFRTSCNHATGYDSRVGNYSGANAVHNPCAKRA